MIIEVFKTDVADPHHATLIVEHIQSAFPGYYANFDLTDCDKILRVSVATGSVDNAELIKIVEALGFAADVLPDEIPHLI
jgi:hypothetical protein